MVPLPPNWKKKKKNSSQGDKWSVNPTRYDAKSVKLSQAVAINTEQTAVFVTFTKF